MAIQKTEKIWHNGKLIPWDEATLHVMSHVVNYGSSVFEGIRCYELPTGPAIFRAPEHMQRLLDSAKIYRIDVDYTRDELVAALTAVVKNNGVWPCYIRPIVLRGYGEAGVNPVQFADRGLYLQLSLGQVSGDRRSTGRGCLRIFMDPHCSQYASRYGQIRRELHEFAAHQDGSHCQRLREGIALDADGYVSEGSGENVFVVRNGVLQTAPLGNSVLPGITRDSVLQIARDLGIPVVEQIDSARNALRGR